MFYPISANISFDQIRQNLLAGEAVREIYTGNGDLLGYLTYDVLYNPRAESGENSVQVVHCCMNCDHNKYSKHYCNKFHEERRDDTVCKYWTKSSPERTKKVLRFNSLRNSLKNKDYSCVICHKEQNFTYIVKDELWEKIAGVNKDKIICLPCFEKMLGRTIMIDDLKPDVACNQLAIATASSELIGGLSLK